MRPTAAGRRRVDRPRVAADAPRCGLLEAMWGVVQARGLGARLRLRGYADEHLGRRPRPRSTTRDFPTPARGCRRVSCPTARAAWSSAAGSAATSIAYHLAQLG